MRYIACYSMFKTIHIPSFSRLVNAVKVGEYGKIFMEESDAPDIELEELSSQQTADDHFYADLVNQPDTSITILISFIIPALLCLGHIFTYKSSIYNNFFSAYIFAYLSVSLATIFVILSLVIITLCSNKLNMGKMSNTKESFLPLLCGFSYAYIPILVALKIITIMMLLGWAFKMSAFIALFIFIFVTTYFSISSAKISVMTMNAMPTMSKDKKHVWLVASSVFTTKMILSIHIYLHLV